MNKPETLLDYWLIVYRRRLIVLATVIAAAVSAFVSSASFPPIYRAQTDFYVAAGSQSGGFLSRGGALSSLSSIARPVVQKESMKSYKGMLESLTVAELVQKSVPGTDRAQLERNLDVAATSTNMIRVRFRDSDAVRAAAVANAFPEALNRFLLDTERRLAERSVAEMAVLLAELNAELQSRRSELQAFIAEVQDPTLTTGLKLRDETLRYEIKVIEENFATLVKNYQEARVQMRAIDDKVVVVSPAEVDESPIFPLPIVNVVVALILSTVVGIYLALFYDYLLRIRQGRQTA